MRDEQLISENTLGNKEEEINLYALFFKYFIYWHWFAASVVVCLIACYCYLRYQAPVYNVTSAVLIKEDDRRGGSGNNPLSAVQELGMFSMTNNFNNEVEILKSRTLIRKVITDLGLYINLAEKRTFGYDTPLYKSSPINVFMTSEEAERLEAGVRMDITYEKGNGLSVKLKYKLNDKKEVLEETFSKLPAIFPTPVGVFSFTVNDSILNDAAYKDESSIHLKAYVNSPTSLAESYVDKFKVTPTSKTTTIALLSLQTTVKQRGVDFINRLIAFYNQDTNDEKNEVAQKSAEFIEERIAIINRELGTTESELADFKRRSGLTNLTQDAQLALQENSKYEQLRIENATQISLVTYLRDYINNPQNLDEVLPANVGYTDANLTSVIDQYNTMIVERKRLLRTSSEDNPAVIYMNTKIEAMRRNVQTTVNSVLKGLQITRDDITRQVRKFEGRISDAPIQEKEFMTISRQQEIKATLYIMLLQKREENAITLAATANNGRVIEEPLVDKDPVSPRKKVFMLVAFVLGLGIPFGIIYLQDLLKYKIENREDIEKITDVAVLGEIPLGEKNGEGAIVIQENKNNVMEETFRALRTNMLFMLGDDEKVVLFTSSQPGEGKSFIAGNMAVSLAYMGKKVLIVGMDIRKPGLNKVLSLSRRVEGLTNYLRDPEHVNLLDLIQHSTLSKNLDILPGGPIPPNPTELVARDVLDKAIDEMKKHYDYIILDTAPIGMVTDTAIIARVADLGVYVCRADATPKAAYAYINVLKSDKIFPKLATVINSIDMSKRKNAYGYGYGKKYGYGYGKHYGYGYGYENEQSAAN